MPSAAAKYLGVSPKTLLNWVKAGRLASVKTVGGHNRYRKSALDAIQVVVEPELEWINVAIRIYRAEEMSIRELAEEFDMGYQHMRRILRERIALRGPGGDMRERIARKKAEQ